MSKPNKPAESKPAESNKETASAPAPSSTVAVAAAAAEVTKVEVDVKGLRTELERRGIGFDQFAAGDEYVRKRILKDDYQELKTKYGWKYDQPIA